MSFNSCPMIEGYDANIQKNVNKAKLKWKNFCVGMKKITLSHLHLIYIYGILSYVMHRL